MDIKKELIEGIIQEIIKFLCEDKDYDIEKSMDIVYNSQIFVKLSDVETGLYIESPSYVYELLKDELHDGVIIQKEQ
ncbi:hypothetical protein [Clostridium grantii]|uniref:Uncharacterized protein n=1 Tax=Clostridium grantii DSM 8605 TaxID=1121316 RepID=A0A1M5WW11_9CLOT|nr:hypothetical protein [Clostridium grantii]SHH91670.1 hypothetical protein SAMN02745207_03150 [Clostridium grantii DSM 8605]